MWGGVEGGGEKDLPPPCLAGRELTSGYLHSSQEKCQILCQISLSGSSECLHRVSFAKACINGPLPTAKIHKMTYIFSFYLHICKLEVCTLYNVQRTTEHMLKAVLASRTHGIKKSPRNNTRFNLRNQTGKSSICI
jgi:hypothetical protein